MGYPSYLPVAEQYRAEHGKIAKDEAHSPPIHATDNRNPHMPINPATLSLEDLFFRDLSSTMSVYGGKTFHSQKFGNIHIRTCSSVDLGRNVITVGYYIPFWNDTAKLVKDLFSLLDVRQLIKDDLVIRAETKEPGDSDTRSSSDAVFSGIVYIYHEKEMSAEDIGALTKIYTSKSIRVQFRSQSYLEVTKLKAQGVIQK